MLMLAAGVALVPGDSLYSHWEDDLSEGGM